MEPQRDESISKCNYNELNGFQESPKAHQRNPHHAGAIQPNIRAPQNFSILSAARWWLKIDAPLLLTAEIVGYGRLIWAPAESKRRRPLIDLVVAQMALNIICRTTGGNEMAPKGVADWRELARLHIRLFALAVAPTSRVGATFIYMNPKKLTANSARWNFKSQHNVSGWDLCIWGFSVIFPIWLYKKNVKVNPKLEDFFLTESSSNLERCNCSIVIIFTAIVHKSKFSSIEIFHFIEHHAMEEEQYLSASVLS